MSYLGELLEGSLRFRKKFAVEFTLGFLLIFLQEFILVKHGNYSLQVSSPHSLPYAVKSEVTASLTKLSV